MNPDISGRSRSATLLAFLCLNVLAGAARGQTPAPPQQPPPPPPKTEGSAEFAFVGTSGNASTQTIGVGGEVHLPAVAMGNEHEAQVRPQRVGR